MIEGVNKIGEGIREPQVNYQIANGEVGKLIKPENKALDEAVSKNEEPKNVSQVECQTCKNRRYVDGSNEGNVSFKTPQHVSPEASFAAVYAHEQEHVRNAEVEGGGENAKLLRASVQLHTAICPECGRAYVAGGVTKTAIQYSNPNAKEDDSYKEGLKGLQVDGKF